MVENFVLYFHNLMKPWDNAGSFVIAKESGAVVTDFKGKKIDFWSSEVVIGNEKLVKRFVERINL